MVGVVAEQRWAKPPSSSAPPGHPQPGAGDERFGERGAPPLTERHHASDDRAGDADDRMVRCLEDGGEEEHPGHHRDRLAGAEPEQQPRALRIAEAVGAEFAGHRSAPSGSSRSPAVLGRRRVGGAPAMVDAGEPLVVRDWDGPPLGVTTSAPAAPVAAFAGWWPVNPATPPDPVFPVPRAAGAPDTPFWPATPRVAAEAPAEAPRLLTIRAVCAAVVMPRVQPRRCQLRPSLPPRWASACRAPSA